MSAKATPTRLVRSSWKTLTLAFLAAAAIAALAFLLLVPLRHVLALAFAGLLLAVAWSTLADVVSAGGRLPHALAVALVGLLGLALWLGFFMWLGPLLADQFQNLGARLHEAVDAARGLIASSETWRAIERGLPGLQDQASHGGLVSRIWTAVSVGFGAVGDALIIFFVGLFLALNPSLYRRGALHLVPSPQRLRAGGVMLKIGKALRRWLLARLVLMLMVGVIFGVGLWILGVPLALPLGVIAGVLEFVPYIGPLSAMVPALAVGLMEGPRYALYVAILYALTQLVESYVAEPLIEGRALSLPPALILLFQVVCGLWLGILGIVIATPLLVVVMVAVQTLYVRGALGDPVPVSGQGAPREESLLPGSPAHGGA